MESLFRYQAPVSPCGYLPDRAWSLEYELVGSLSPAEYGQRMREGWRRFGHSLFRPQCPAVPAVPIPRVKGGAVPPQRRPGRWRKVDHGNVGPRHGSAESFGPKAKALQSLSALPGGRKGWPEHPAKDAASYRESF